MLNVIVCVLSAYYSCSIVEVNDNIQRNSSALHRMDLRIITMFGNIESAHIKGQKRCFILIRILMYRAVKPNSEMN